MLTSFRLERELKLTFRLPYREDFVHDGLSYGDGVEEAICFRRLDDGE